MNVSLLEKSAGEILPTFSYDQIANQLVTGYWSSNGLSPHHFPAAGIITYNIAVLTGPEQELARKAFDAWTMVSGINFQPVATGMANITFSNAGDYANTTPYPGDVYTGALIDIGTSYLEGDTSLGGHSFETYIHEIGHALGLGHAGNYNFSLDGPAIKYGTDNFYLNDTLQATVMSYFDQTNIDASHANPVTPMIADILAIQSMYGTATNLRLGDTTYGEHSTAGGYYNQFTSLSKPIAFTIIDSGGIDTVDFGTQISGQHIDLNSEAISDVLGLTGNMIIARGTIIENAISGSGNDSLVGNEAANKLTGGGGNDTLEGGAGDDALTGGDGVDTAAYTGAYDSYKIQFNSDGTVSISDANGNDTLTSVEKAKFSDRVIDLRPGQDIAFVIDTTGSMDDDIGAVKAKAAAIIDAIFDASRGFLDSHMAVVGYNDPTTQTILSFTTNENPDDRKQAAIDAINSITVGGGGDIPEMVNSGLIRALDGSAGEWRADAVSRKVILFGDAPPKDTDLADQVRTLAANINATVEGHVSSVALSSSLYMTNFMLADASGDPIAVQIFTVVIGDDGSTINSFESIATDTGGATFSVEDADDLVDTLIDVIRTPIFDIRADNATVLEGLSGTTTATFTISRDIGESAATVMLERFGTSDAADANDVATRIEFAAGEMSKTVTVDVAGDTTVEADETYGVKIVGVSTTATINTASAEFEILNDDVTRGNTAPVLTSPISDQSVKVGANLLYTILPNTFTDADGDVLTYSLTLANGDPLPSWVTYDSDTNKFRVSPVTTDIGTFSFKVTASDGLASSSDIFEMTVSSENSPTGENIIGTYRGELLNGTSKSELIDGRGGADVISGNAGNDDLIGGLGSDNILGGSGNDSIVGDSHTWNVGKRTDNDILFGESGNDGLYGNNGNDKLFGGAGKDWMDGGIGRDTLTGNAGADQFQTRTFSLSDQFDIFTDFRSSDGDKILVDSGSHGSIHKDKLFYDHAPAKYAKECLVYDEDSGKLFLYNSPIMNDDVELLAVLRNHAHLSQADFVFA